VRGDEIQAVAERFFRAIEEGDLDAVKACYASDAVVWHNYDRVEQPVADNLVTLAFVVGAVANRRYEEVRRVVLDDGFVQQHVLRGDAPGGRLEMPAMMRVWVADGRVTRIDEYLDPAQANVLATPR
jgi:ketosteroid isomerase-like protein